MGMDVYGKNPSSDEGKYFRNNVWWWHPLWTYCYAIAEDLISEEVYQLGHSNDGAGLGADASKKLAFRLKGAIAEGHTKRYEIEYTQKLEALPDEVCGLCEGTGVRTDEIGVNLGMDVRKECNGCKSTGKTRPFETEYPFSEENVKEFATFLEACGGFEIC